jgi:phage/plasmid-associated DNA primase
MRVSTTINYIKDTKYIDRSEFDKNPDIRNVANGLLNLQTRELDPHTRLFIDSSASYRV